MSASDSRSSLRVALIRNYVSDYQWGSLNVASFKRRFQMFEPGTEVDVYAPISGDQFPDPDKYDLVVLSGGPVSLLERPLPQWTRDLLNYVRLIAKDHPKTKLLGICWGHLALSMAMGGRVGLVDGSTIGVKRYELTSHGKQFFNKGPGDGDNTLAIAKFHRRFVRDMPPGFWALLEDNEGFLSQSGQMLSFQGHPEMDKATAAMCLEEDDGTYTGGRTEAQVDDMTGDFATDDHDGILMFEHIVQWAKDQTFAVTPSIKWKL